jgi:hypothetical protein
LVGSSKKAQGFDPDFSSDMSVYAKPIERLLPLMNIYLARRVVVETVRVDKKIRVMNWV